MQTARRLIRLHACTSVFALVLALLWSVGWGQVHRVLAETPRMGRTEQFTEVDFAADQPEGRIVAAGSLAVSFWRWVHEVPERVKT